MTPELHQQVQQARVVAAPGGKGPSWERRSRRTLRARAAARLARTA